MEKMTKQYEIAVSNAAEISQVFLDMEGGKYILALFNELVQELLDEGNISGATLAMRKFHDAAEIRFDQLDPDEDDSIAWITFFTEAIDDAFEESII